MSLSTANGCGLFCILLLTLPNILYAEDCQTFDALDIFETAGIPPAGADCSTYLTATAGTGISCHWEHPYRAESARVKASILWETLTRCRDGKEQAPDKQVNHPDSYDLRALAHGTTIYVLSVKDKAVLSRTLVFLRREPAGEGD